MGNGKAEKFARTSNREADVKPWGPGAKADSPVAGRVIENPMFGADLMEVTCASVIPSFYKHEQGKWDQIPARSEMIRS